MKKGTETLARISPSFRTIERLKSAREHAVMGHMMKTKRLTSRAMNHAFSAAAETLALFCRLRNIDAADMPAQDIDMILDIAFEEAAQQAAARAEAQGPG